VVGVLGVLALLAGLVTTAIEGIPKEDLWFAVKALLGVAYLTALSTYVAWHRKAPAGWIPWLGK
jgi:hypothetical protein